MRSCFDTRSLHTRRRCLEQPLRFIATTRVAVFVHSAKTGGATASAFLENCSGVFVAYAAHTLTAAQVIATGRAAILTLRDPAQRAVSNTQWAGGLGRRCLLGLRVGFASAFLVCFSLSVRMNVRDARKRVSFLKRAVSAKVRPAAASTAKKKYGEKHGGSVGCVPFFRCTCELLRNWS